MNITDRTSATQLINSLAQTGAKTPVVVTEAWSTTARLSRGVREIGVYPEVIYDAVASALERGKDPAADREVQRILASGRISNEGVIAGVDNIAYDRFRKVCVDHADEIVDALREPFDAAVKRLTEAHVAIGPIDLADTDTVARRGDTTASMWAVATAAVAAIGNIVTGWMALGEFADVVTLNPRHQVLRIAAPTFEQWETHGLEGRHAEPWVLLNEGLDLSLPTFSEYRYRIAVIEQGPVSQVPIDHTRSHIAGREIRVGGS